MALDVADYFFRFVLGAEELDDFSLVVDHELGEIPRDLLGSSCLGIVKLTVVAKVGEQRMSILSIDLYLFHHWELHVEVLFDEVLDFLWRPAFLTEELVAREG